MSTLSSFVFILNVSLAVLGYHLWQYELKKEEISQIKVLVAFFIFCSNGILAALVTIGMLATIFS